MGTALAIISLLAAIGGSVAAGVKANQAGEEVRSQKGLMAKQQAEQENLFNRQYYQDMTDRTEVSDMLRKLEEQNDTDRKRTEATAAITGATDEAKLAAADSRNKRRADAIAGIASNASTLKDQYLNDWRNRMDNYLGQQINMSDKMAAINQNMSNQWSQMATNAYKTGFNMMGQPDWGGDNQLVFRGITHYE